MIQGADALQMRETPPLFISTALGRAGSLGPKVFVRPKKNPYRWPRGCTGIDSGNSTGPGTH